MTASAMDNTVISVQLEIHSFAEEACPHSLIFVNSIEFSFFFFFYCSASILKLTK